MARPKKQISQKQFESLCYIQCTHEEICSVLDVSADTLNRWCMETYKQSFSIIFSQKRDGGKASLRRTQWKQAETNPTMAIWLGKQLLKQNDNKEAMEIKREELRIKQEQLELLKQKANLELDLDDTIEITIKKAEK